MKKSTITRKLLPLAMIFVLALSLTACARGGGASQTVPQESPSTAEAAGSDSAAAPAQQSGSAEFIIKIGHVVDEENAMHKGIVMFKDYVEKESGGRIACEIFPNALLGGDRELVEGVELGTIQMSGPATTVLVSYIPEFGVLDMPFLFSSEEAGFQALDNELGEYLDNLLVEKVGIINLGYGYNGARAISNNVRPILEPADLQGIKIRVMESPIYIDTFKALGANPTPMSFGEVFTALQQGTVDGQDNAAPLTYSSRFHEVQKYFTNTGHTHSFLPMIMNKDFYDSLPDDLKEIVQTGAKLYMVDEQRKMEVGERDIAIQHMVDDAGTQVDVITPENYQKFVDAVQSVYEKNAETITPELVEMAKKYN